MAAIRKHRNKWQAQVRRTGHPARVRSFSHKSDAQAWARKVERQIDGGEFFVDQTVLKKTTVRDLLIRYRDEVTPGKRGAAMERYKIETLLSHPIASATLQALSPSYVAGYRDDRLKTVQASTVRRELSVLRHCFEVSRKEWGIPMSDISAPGTP